MDEIRLRPDGALSPAPQTPAFRVNPAFTLIPAAGLIGAMAAISRYRPVDQRAFLALTLVAFFAIIILIAHVRQKARRGEDVSSFFPLTYWLALAPALLALAFWINGALDHSAPELHRQVVTRKTVSHGRHGTGYYIEFTSWRPQRTTERIGVPYQQYLEMQVDDPIIVDLHRGALAIPWIGGVRKAD
jgi:hypothetical protein